MLCVYAAGYSNSWQLGDHPWEATSGVREVGEHEEWSAVKVGDPGWSEKESRYDLTKCDKHTAVGCLQEVGVGNMSEEAGNARGAKCRRKVITCWRGYNGHTQQRWITMVNEAATHSMVIETGSKDGVQQSWTHHR